MTYRAERFNKSMRSLEAMLSGMADASKSAKLSDRGKSAARMYAAFEPEPDAPDRNQELTGAVLRGCPLPRSRRQSRRSRVIFLSSRVFRIPSGNPPPGRQRPAP